MSTIVIGLLIAVGGAVVAYLFLRNNPKKAAKLTDVVNAATGKTKSR